MKTCLVVDDSGVVRKIARRILEGMEFTVIEAEDGAVALEACKLAMPKSRLTNAQCSSPPFAWAGRFATSAIPQPSSRNSIL